MPSFAFSIHNFISSVGADAGFAAIIGLAVLVLLYFAHARESANLREDAALLTQRLQQAEARVVELSRMQSAAAAAPVAEQRVAPAALAMAPFAPAGMGAPALASATRVVPLRSAVPEQAEPAAQPAAAPIPAMAMAGVAGAGPLASAQAPPTPGPVLPAPSPAPAPPVSRDVPGGDGGAAAPSPAAPGRPAPATNAGGNGSGHGYDLPAPVPGGPPARSSQAPLSAQPPSRLLPPLEYSRKRRRSRLGRGAVVALVALVVVVAAVVLFAVTSVGGSSPSPSASTTNAPSGSPARGAFRAASVTVAVLNGTAVNQLAHRVSDRLTALGYKPGTIATASNQTERNTIVAYRPGSKNRTDAQHVASALRLRRSAVQRIDPGTLQVACPTPSGCAANVVVTVGADLASQ